MAIPSLPTDLGSTTASNSPLGSDSVGSPATVDDFFRSHAAIMRMEGKNKSWELRGDAPTYVSGTVFTLSGDQRTHYATGRRIKALGNSTVYGTITSQTFTANTAVTALYDGASTLDASLSAVHLGPHPDAIPVSAVVTSFLPLAGGTMAGDISMSNQDVVGVKTVTVFGEVNHGNSGAAKSISFSGGQNCRVTINADTVLTICTPPGQGFFQLRMIQDGTGAHTVSFVNLVQTRFVGNASQPAINAAANGETILTLFWNGAFGTAIQSLQKIGAA